jgi:hypothetical protein
MKRWIWFLLLLELLLTTAGFAKSASKQTDSNLFNMSLEQLMDVGVYAPATITETNRLKTPASVTVITSHDIAITPARNILDLIEIYVPGALWMNHSIGPVLGMRGIIADKPYKFLVNVNGMNINIKSTYGARLELLNWELSDIDRIEIVRGPGSVTYGPGAIGGVINIYTKQGKQAQGFENGGQYFSKYDSFGEYISYGKVKDDFQLYTYFSAVTTNGISPDLFATDSKGRFGYMGEPGGPASTPSATGKFGTPPATYMGDFFNEPQYKANLDIRFNENWRFWGRYVTESSQLTQSTAQKYLIDGKFRDLRLSRFRYFQLALENQTDINKDWDLKSTFGLSSTDIRDIQKEFGTSSDPGKIFNINDNSKNNLRNYGLMYSEWEYYAQFMLNYRPDDSKLKGALGYEVSYDTIRPSWGKNKDNGLRLGSDYGIISGPSSDAYGTETSAGQVNSSSNFYYPVGNGFEAVNHSVIGELNYELTPKTTVILSGRFDKNTYTDMMFSPRFALIQELNRDEYLKFIVQRSVRMNTLDELYINDKKGVTNFPEKLDMLELIWTKKVNEHWSFENSAFYSKNKAIGWDSVSRSAAPLGTLELFGIESELKYQNDNYEIGINHSIVKQLNWKLAEGIENSGISYSDYFSPSTNSTTVTIGSNGNDLSNWANQATKLYTNIELLEGKATLHGDIETFWGFEGLQDGLEAYERASGANAANLAAVRDKDAFGVQSRANLSLTFHLTKDADFSIFLQNIAVFGDNKRYSYSSGQKNSYLDKASWVEEPMVVGVKYKLRF